MKKLIPILLCCSMLLLSACSRYPDAADDGVKWDRTWEMLGTSLGVAPPGHDLQLLENNVVLAASDTYYASWVAGEPSVYVNEGGKNVDLYPLQVYLLYYGCADHEAAEEAMEDWMNRERETYDILSEDLASFNDQDYTLLTYRPSSPANPYAGGIAAFGVFHHYVISAELTYTEDFAEDPAEVLASFLQSCHYSTKAVK